MRTSGKIIQPEGPAGTRCAACPWRDPFAGSGPQPDTFAVLFIFRALNFPVPLRPHTLITDLITDPCAIYSYERHCAQSSQAYMRRCSQRLWRSFHGWRHRSAEYCCKFEFSAAVCFLNANINSIGNNKMNKTHDFILAPFGKTKCEMKSSVL